LPKFLKYIKPHLAGLPSRILAGLPSRILAGLPSRSFSVGWPKLSN
jgi:hypothetical protein